MTASTPAVHHPAAHPLGPGISRQPEVEGDETAKASPHIDTAEVQTAEGELDPFVSIDRTSKSAFVQLVGGANRVIA